MAPAKTRAPAAAKKVDDAKPVEEVAPVVATVTDEVAVTADTTDSFVVVTEKLNGMLADLKALVVVVKGLQKEYNKLKKQTAKKSKGRKAADGAEGGAPRVQSGFAKPTLLSDALCNFLGVPSGSMLARTEVTRKINEYIKTNKLQTDADRRVIVPDDKLKAILELKEGVPLSFFNLQGCLKNHFLKAAVA